MQIVMVACLPVEVVQALETPSGPPWSPPSSSPATPTLLSLLFVGPFVGLAYVAGTARLGLWSFWWGLSFAAATAEPSPPDLLLLLFLG